MKEKLKIALAIIIGVALTIPSGLGLVELFEYMGANMITIKAVVGCYLFPAAVWGLLIVFTLDKIDGN